MKSLHGSISVSVSYLWHHSVSQLISLYWNCQVGQEVKTLAATKIAGCWRCHDASHWSALACAGSEQVEVPYSQELQLQCPFHCQDVSKSGSYQHALGCEVPAAQLWHPETLACWWERPGGCSLSHSFPSVLLQAKVPMGQRFHAVKTCQCCQNSSNCSTWTLCWWALKMQRVAFPSYSFRVPCSGYCLCVLHGFSMSTWVSSRRSIGYTKLPLHVNESVNMSDFGNGMLSHSSCRGPVFPG